MCIRAPEVDFKLSPTACTVRIRKESNGRVSEGVPDPTNHQMMLGLMHIRHDVMQQSVLFLGPLGDLARQIVDATQKIETTNSCGIEQLHEDAVQGLPLPLGPWE